MKIAIIITGHLRTIEKNIKNIKTFFNKTN